MYMVTLEWRCQDEMIFQLMLAITFGDGDRSGRAIPIHLSVDESPLVLPTSHHYLRVVSRQQLLYWLKTYRITKHDFAETAKIQFLLCVIYFALNLIQAYYTAINISHVR